MIWDFQDALTRRLLLWAALSMIAGAFMLLLGESWWRGFGLQAIAWGAIDATIALGGRYATNKRRAHQPLSDHALLKESANLRRLLWINTGLDVVYVAGGLILAATLGRNDPFARGLGWGIVAQGGFLFVFDLLHAWGAPRSEPKLPALAAFDALEHQPFDLEGNWGGALLVHGFGGTPAELRALGDALHENGWTVDAPLLPGFGSDIQTLTQRRYEEWLAVVISRAEHLRARVSGPLLIVGYSMGASLALVSARTLRPAGLALLAPFWWEEKLWLRIAEFFVRPFLPVGFRPLRKADLNSEQLRAGILKFMPGLDLNDPAVQAGMRNFRVPLGLIDQLRRLSRSVLSSTAEAAERVLVVQGARDTVARPALTRQLVAKLPAGARYVEIDSEHDLTVPSNPRYLEVEREIVTFAEKVSREAK